MLQTLTLLDDYDINSYNYTLIPIFFIYWVIFYLVSTFAFLSETKKNKKMKVGPHFRSHQHNLEDVYNIFLIAEQIE